MGLYEDLDLVKAGQSQLEQQFGQLSSEYQTLLQSDPYGAEQKKAEASQLLGKIQLFSGEGEKLKAQLADDLKNSKYLTYGLGDTNAQISFSDEAIKNKTAEALSKFIGEPVDVTTGLGYADRTADAFLRDESKDEYLINKYGKDNVKTVNVGGSPTRLVKNETGKWIAMNEMGGSLKDALPVLGEIFPLAGSILGGIGLSALPGAPPVASMAVGGGAGYAAAGTFQDQIAKAYLKAGDGLAESFGKRSTEALLGAGLEYGAGKLASPFLRKMGTAKVDEYYQGLKKAEEDLASRGYSMNVAQLVQGGEIQNKKWLQLAQDRPNSQVAKDIQIGVERLQRLKSDLTPAQKSSALYKSTLDNIRQAQQTTADMVGLYDRKAGDILRSNLDEQTQSLVFGGLEDTHKLGSDLFQALGKAEAKANDIKNETYAPFYELAKGKVSVDPIELAKFVEKNYYNSVLRNPTLQAELDALRARPQNLKKITSIDNELKSVTDPDKIAQLQLERARLEQLSGNLDVKQLNDTVRVFSEAYPDAGMTGATASKQVAGTAANDIRTFRNNVLDNQGLLDEWNNATQVFNQRLGFEEGAIGKYLKELSSGKPNMDETQIVNSMLSTPRTITDAVTALSVGDPATASQLVKRLQNAYFKNIGISNQSGRQVDGFNFDEDVVRSLFGFNSAGKPNSAYGDNMIRKLYSLQDAINAKNLDPAKLTMKDIDDLSGTLSRNSEKELRDSIEKRIRNQMSVDQTKNDSLMKIALNGHREVLVSGEFPEALWNANPDQVKKLLKLMPDADKEVLSGDMAEHLFAKYPPSGEYGIHGELLWNGKLLLKDFAKNPKRVEVLRGVLGNEAVDNVISASKLMQAAKNKPIAKGIPQGGGVINNAGVKWYFPIERIASGIRNTWMSAAYRTGDLVPLLRNIARKEITEEEFKKNVSNTMLKLAKTSAGIEAMTQSGRYNPEWSAWLGNNLGTTSKETQQYQEKFGIGR
jgi:hypothetical protein